MLNFLLSRTRPRIRCTTYSTQLTQLPFLTHLTFTLATFLFLSCLSHSAENAYTIAVIPKGTTHEFWKSINAGAIKAQRELSEKGTKTEIIWKGPLREDDRDQQIQV